MAGKWLMLGAIGLLAVGAAPGGYSTGQQARNAGGGYPPCSRTVTDRCIQLYERGVRSAANLALNARLGMPGGQQAQLASAPAGRYVADPKATKPSPAPAPAMGGPFIPADAGVARTGWSAPARPEEYPACTRLITDRCIQLNSRGRRI